MLILGIDPGAATGAYAAIGDAGLQEIGDLPILSIAHGRGSRSELDVSELYHLISRVKPHHCCIESVGPMPKQGVVSVWRFGYAAGCIYTAVMALGVSLTAVRPQDWQKHHRIGKGPDDARRRAVELFPTHAPTFARKRDNHRADAVLIAAYGRYILAQSQPTAV